MRRGPHVSDWACPVSTLTQSTGPTGPTGRGTGVAPGQPRRRQVSTAAGATPASQTRRRGSGGVRVSRTGGLRGRGWARSTRLGAARPTVVAGVAGTDGGEHFELARGEVLRASNGNGGTARDRAIQRAGRGLHARASKIGASKRPKGRRNDAGDELRRGASGRSTGSTLRGSTKRGGGGNGPARTC